MTRDFIPMATIVPVGKKGEARIEHRTISEDEAKFTMLRAMQHGMHEYVRPGQYCHLYVGGQLYMSDTQMEHSTNLDLLYNAQGSVLIAGLGIGMVLVPLLMKDTVTSVVVVEKSQDVIDLVQPHFTPNAPFWVDKQSEVSKLRIYCGDVFDWDIEAAMGCAPAFNTIYFDIWPDQCTDNLDDMVKLRRKYKKYRAKDHAWVGCWCEDILRRRRRQERKHERETEYFRGLLRNR